MPLGSPGQKLPMMAELNDVWSTSTNRCADGQ